MAQQNLTYVCQASSVSPASRLGLLPFTCMQHATEGQAAVVGVKWKCVGL